MTGGASSTAVLFNSVFSLEAPGPLGLLRGTALRPGSWNGQVVLMTPGSGPTDRDGNSPLGIRASTLRLLAEGLAEQGVASVRIDKRGLFGSAQAVLDGDAVTIHDYVDDTRSWVQVICKHFEVRGIWVLGHSEGGLVALSTDPEDSQVHGLILLAVPGRTLGQLLREQLAGNPANREVLGNAFTAIEELETGRRVETRTFYPALQSLFRPSVQGFLIDLMALNPSERIARFKKPVLIVQGESDLQVSDRDAQLLANGAVHPTLHMVPGANHVFKVAPCDDRDANTATYADPDLPLAGGAIDAVLGFIYSNGKNGEANHVACAIHRAT